MIRCALLLGLVAQACIAITIPYTARVKDGAPGSGIGLADFLSHYGRGTIPSPGGYPDAVDILFEGSFSFKYPQKNQNCGGSGNCPVGLYDLDEFTINGQSLQKPSGFSFQEISLAVSPLGDSYQVVFSPLVFPSLSDGKERFLSLQLELSLPPGTLGTSALPPDIRFFSKAVSYESGQVFNYGVFNETNVLLGGFGGHTVWTSAGSLESVPEPSSSTLLIIALAPAGLWWRIRAKRSIERS